MWFYITFLIFLLFFFFVKSVFEKLEPKIGHETCVVLIAGIIWSIIFYAIHKNDETFDNVYEFKPSLFFDAILPPIVFNAGFNMKRKKFFQNLGNILMFGLAVTLVCFILYSTFSWIVLTYKDLKMTDFVSEKQMLIAENFSLMQLMLFTALLCSSDVVAAVSIVDYDAQPKLYSCIFGEGVANDIVSIVLFNVVTRL